VTVVIEIMLVFGGCLFL